MHKTHLFHTLILLAFAAQLSAAPRLTVVVVVDGLRQDNLTLMHSYWPQGGMRTCSEEGLCTTVRFPHWVFGGDETTATWLTGTTPLSHGYSMDRAYSRRDGKTYAILEDKQAEGIGTNIHISPRNLLSETIADKMRLAYGDASKIYAVGIHPNTTILLAGHAANACCWMNADNLQWCSTTYYSEGLPSVADAMNVNGRFAEMASRTWNQRLEISMYSHPTEEEKQKGFSYVSNQYLLNTPVANSLVVELALAIQKEHQLGEDNIPDMMLLEMNLVSPKATSDRILTAEQEDLHLALNQDIGFLMEQLTKRIGKENFDLLIVGKPVLGASQEQLASINIPARKFNLSHTAALTATYMMAIYGHERWIEGAYGQSIYLNRSLIEQKHLSFETLQRQVADFLMEFEGVQLAYPFRDAIYYDDIRSSINKRNVGDVIFTLEPGWQLMENDWRAIDNVIDDQTATPVLFWSGSGKSWPERPKNATEIKDLIIP